MKQGISIIVPVWHEASIIHEAVSAILSLPYKGDREVIVVDGSPHGETIEAIRNPGVKTALAEKGRSKQMNKGAALASGEILFFVHVDTELPEGALNALSSVMGQVGVVAGAFDLGIRSERPVFRIIEKAASLRSRITRIPYGDQAIFVMRDYFRAMAGFREIPLMEDLDFMKRIRKAGDKIVIIPEKVMTSPRRWEKEGILYCTLRNWTLRTLYLLGIPPETLAKLYP
ncbi:MAG TPA: TIGR04283 family arsenosugar biosynthesis glycosyltransferase [Thermodesulfovibrionales bacterium]|nr:TIGR04283 family arsenosugar biosynthesis glycosyltransferase [Thermodesulfovibrionales bacterium]